MYALDTNSCIYWLERRSEPLVARAIATPPAEIAIPSVVAGELHFGMNKSARPEENQVRLAAFLEGFPRCR